MGWTYLQSSEAAGPCAACVQRPHPGPPPQLTPRTETTLAGAALLALPTADCPAGQSPPPQHLHQKDAQRLLLHLTSCLELASPRRSHVPCKGNAQKLRACKVIHMHDREWRQSMCCLPAFPPASVMSDSPVESLSLEPASPLKPDRSSENPPLLKFLSWPFAALSAISAQLLASLQQRNLLETSKTAPVVSVNAPLHRAGRIVTGSLCCCTL